LKINNITSDNYFKIIWLGMQVSQQIFKKRIAMNQLLPKQVLGASMLGVVHKLPFLSLTTVL
jgi:hypothetical protein